MNTDIKTFPLIFTIPFHKKVKLAAALMHLSMNKYIMEAIIEKMQKEQ